MAGRIAYYGNIVRDGLVLDLDAAKRDSYPESGTVWRDIAGGVITGSLINGPTFDPNNAGSIVFDGVDDYVDCSVSPSLDITSDLTINIWLYSTKTMTGVGAVTKGPLSGDYDYMLYITANSTSIAFYKKNSLGVPESVGFNSSILNRWVNICFTKQGTVVNNYENSILKNPTTFSTSDIRVTSNSLKIGNGWSSAYGGNIPILQIYNRGLSAAEVLQNYNATKGRFGL
jgi:hypothetical protein